MFLVAASQVANLANMLFQAVIGRALNPEEYGVLATMLNAVNIAVVPLGALGTAAAHFAARSMQLEVPRQVFQLLRHWLAYLAAPAILFLLLIAPASGPVAGFFHLEDPTPVIVTGILLSLTLFMPIFGGLLQGLQSYYWGSLVGITWAFLRLTSGWLLITLFGKSAVWALVGQVIAVVGALLVGQVALRSTLRGLTNRAAVEARRTRAYVANSVPALMGLAIFMSGDMILTKHFFEPETAGYAARAFQIGRVMFFLVMPVVRALFPKVVSAGDTSQADWRLLLRGWLYAAAGAGAAVVGCCLLPQVPIYIFFGRDAVTPEMEQLVRYAACAMAPIGLLAVCVHFELAQRRFVRTLPVAVCAVGYVATVIRRHDTVTDVMLALGVFSAAALLTTVAWQLAQARSSLAQRSD